jgi:hypothetical protein
MVLIMVLSTSWFFTVLAHLGLYQGYLTPTSCLSSWFSQHRVFNIMVHVTKKFHAILYFAISSGLDLACRPRPECGISMLHPISLLY